MITLCMDTAYRYLIVGLYEGDKLLAGVCEQAFKKQSETLFVALEKVLKEADLTIHEIDQVIVSDGPGSYTGIRIAMTVAKVLCSQLSLPLYTVSTMALYAGLDKANVLLDARGHRVYAAHLAHGYVVGTETIIDVDDIPQFIKEWEGIVLGDEDFRDENSPEPDFLANFIKLPCRKVETVHQLVPRYLKEVSSYAPHSGQ